MLLCFRCNRLDVFLINHGQHAAERVHAKVLDESLRDLITVFDSNFELDRVLERAAIAQHTDASTTGLSPTPVGTNSRVRQWPTASYWSNANPNGSMLLWQAAQLAFLACASILCRMVILVPVAAELVRSDQHWLEAVVESY